MNVAEKMPDIHYPGSAEIFVNKKKKNNNNKQVSIVCPPALSVKRCTVSFKVRSLFHYKYLFDVQDVLNWYTCLMSGRRLL